MVPILFITIKKKQFKDTYLLRLHVLLSILWLHFENSFTEPDRLPIGQTVVQNVVGATRILSK